MSVRAPVVPGLVARTLSALGLAWALAASAAAEPIQTGPTSIVTAGPLQLTVAGTEAELLDSDGLRATARWLWKPKP